MHHLCTYFDRNFLIKGLTLYRSLRSHAPDRFELWVLCLDDFTYDILKQLDLKDLHPISMHEFEAGDTELLQAKTNRSRVEYFFTCTPSLPLFVLRQNPGIQTVTYLDADLFFFSSIEDIFRAFEPYSILIIPHRYPARLKRLEDYGIFNVGLLVFRNDPSGIECLEWWRERCLEWCYDRVESGRFADQKYLDDWPQRFSRVVVLHNKGANLAPWNVSQYQITEENGHVKIDGEQLIFYHFHRLKQFNRRVCDPGLAEYQSDPLSRRVRTGIYLPYLRALEDTRRWLRSKSLDIDPGYVRLQP
ncbi:MAG TPA: glycosyl transferase, partial [Terriglobia bacterium]|nr:glycosyl transferase [Terriglobia bacterium]